jgi:hypothetical protein
MISSSSAFSSTLTLQTQANTTMPPETLNSTSFSTNFLTTLNSTNSISTTSESNQGEFSSDFLYETTNEPVNITDLSTNNFSSSSLTTNAASRIQTTSIIGVNTTHILPKSSSLFDSLPMSTTTAIGYTTNLFNSTSLSTKSIKNQITTNQLITEEISLTTISMNTSIEDNLLQELTTVFSFTITEIETLIQTESPFQYTTSFVDESTFCEQYDEVTDKIVENYQSDYLIPNNLN